MTIQYDPLAGTHIADAAKALVALANEHQQPAEMHFNGVRLDADIDDSAEDIAAFYTAIITEQAAAYQRSPEGQRREREAEETRKRQRAAGSEPLPPFTLRDPEVWQRWQDSNHDPYGQAILRYAQRWAGTMEQRMADGANLADIAQETSHEADTEGISGWMASAARGILLQCWVHGAELKRWRDMARL